jgi:hypothetical protein
MTLETAIQNLADAINRLAGVQFEAREAADAMGAQMSSAKPRGRPRKVETEAPAPEVEAPTMAAAAAKVAERIAAVSAETAPTVAKADVQKVLIAVVQKHGRDECGKLCQAHGGPNLSALDPSVYPALLKDAIEVLDRDADPVA